ncbi:unnamed protein product [Vitrella brassicaformis CCMP3155]|uniref:PPPDE domain-containing protein n=1 Tax=Vitrella brassicaformis (strain CCMP3155) TaxID=1169540 RepID=A0A0G4EPN7_VITBC|nr:unnamed protein product [Vitrella brassicaformis CCMP3155]|eukprot:CEL99225.1 unnamed protein product [Vitrella brassicaformis CCMP3155]
MLVRKNIETIWHAGLVVYGREYWFSTHIESKDIQHTESAFGMAPTHVHDMGATTIDQRVFEDYLERELAPRFSLDRYETFTNNCNHMIDEALTFLTAPSAEPQRLPYYILEQSETILDNVSDLQADLTRKIATRVSRLIMVGWAKSNRAKEERERGWASESRNFGRRVVDTGEMSV